MNFLFAATRTGIYRSMNNGDTWEHLVSGLPESFYTSVITDSKDIIYTGNNDGDVFISRDLGKTWNLLAVKNPLREPPVILAVDSLNRLYFGGRDSGVFRYSEIEHMWTPINNGLTNTVIRSLLFTKNGVFFAGTGVVTEPEALKHGDFSKDNFFISLNYGENWSLMNTGLKHPRIRAIAINSKGVIFAGSAGGGVYRSEHPLRPKN